MLNYILLEMDSSITNQNCIERNDLLMVKRNGLNLKHINNQTEKYVN